jgi:putative membrane-bound dehydrogenase-like protein
VQTNRQSFSVQVIGLLLAVVLQGVAAEFPIPYNTEVSKKVPLTPEDAVKRIALPPGFKATLFAGEPDVQQPISMSTDSRGRLWVVENYTYMEGGKGYEKKLRDRVIVLEDTNHDGRFDKRTVFWDKGQRVTSVVCGFGGVWILAAPDLLFFPDSDGNDVPDGEPEVVLTGWAGDDAHHTIVNGLKWGPDGWLYGRQGILGTSFVGRPGTSKAERIAINAGIWRYHPTRKVFEAVAHGTTNPWGMDWNDMGEAFFINTVIGHLWHVIPGAHYQRMFGEDFDRHTYGLIAQHADHYHWDTGQTWQDSRSARGLTDILGGGHAHVGLMFYLGNNWPAKYRDTLFTLNLHGHRLNNDIVVRSGSGYVGKHGQDMMKDDDEWFRPIDLMYGSDGGVFIADWSDVGECHENDGVHRTSGRIYKINYGEQSTEDFGDLARKSDAELVQLQLNPNEWFVRQARLVLQERAAQGRDMTKVHADLKTMFNQQKEPAKKLRALWALYVTGGTTEAWLRKQLSHSNENVRSWAVRLLFDDGKVSDAARQDFVSLAKKDKSGLVRLYLAAALQKMPAEKRWELAAALVKHEEDASDHNMPLMDWYGIEPLPVVDPMRSTDLFKESQIPLVRKFLVRRLTEESNAAPINVLLKLASSPALQSDVLDGMAEAMNGWKQAKVPAAWSEFAGKINEGTNVVLIKKARNLGITFGDPNAIEASKNLVTDHSVSDSERRETLEKLIEKRPDGLPGLLQSALLDKALAVTAVRGLMTYDDPATPALIIGRYKNFGESERTEVIGALVSREGSARALLNAVAEGKIDRRDISPFQARQISSLKDASLHEQLKEVWGDIRSTGDEKKQLIAKYKSDLTPERLKKADLSRGRAVFNKTCALCHTLYGQGAKIGPDLTGSGRADLSYLLENVVDPSAIVGVDYRVSSVTLKDGRELSGIIKNKTERTLTVQGMTETTTTERSEIEEMRNSSLSLMPEGLLESLSEEQRADLIAYLMSPKQVDLPVDAQRK